MSSRELEIKDSCFTVRNLFGVTCVTVKALPKKKKKKRWRGWGVLWTRSRDWLESPNAIEDQPLKQGSWAYCVIAAIEDRGVGRECDLDQEQEEHMTRGQGKGTQRHCSGWRADNNVLWDVSSYCLVHAPSPLSPDLQRKLPHSKPL